MCSTRTFLQTSANRDGASRRQGIEAERRWRPASVSAERQLRLSRRRPSPTPPTASSSSNCAGPSHSGSIAADGALDRWTYGASLAYVGTRRDRREIIPFASCGSAHIGWPDAHFAYALAPRVRAVRCAGPTCSTSAIRISSAIAPKGAACSSGSGWRIGDHRREIGFGGKLAVDARAAGELADARALLDEFDVELEQAAGLDRRAELGARRWP